MESFQPYTRNFYQNILRAVLKCKDHVRSTALEMDLKEIFTVCLEMINQQNVIRNVKENLDEHSIIFVRQFLWTREKKLKVFWRANKIHEGKMTFYENNGLNIASYFFWLCINHFKIPTSHRQWWNLLLATFSVSFVHIPRAVDGKEIATEFCVNLTRVCICQLGSRFTTTKQTEKPLLLPLCLGSSVRKSGDQDDTSDQGLTTAWNSSARLQCWPVEMTCYARGHRPNWKLRKHFFFLFRCAERLHHF